MSRLEETLEDRIQALESASLKLGRSKTEFLTIGNYPFPIKLQGEEIIKTVSPFKYLGSLADTTASTADDISTRVQSGRENC